MYVSNVRVAIKFYVSLRVKQSGKMPLNANLSLAHISKSYGLPQTEVVFEY